MSKRKTLGFGLGLRSEYYQQILEQRPAVDWFEIISENYLVGGGKALYFLDAIGEQYPLVMHGVSLSNAAKSGSLLPEITRLPTNLACLVWRHELVCQYRSLEPAEASALQFLIEGGSFAELCESLSATHGEQAPLQAATWLKLWVNDGLLRKV